MRKNWDNDEGIIPLLIGLGIAGIAGWLGISYLGVGDTLTDFLKAIIIGSLLFTFGVIALLGKFVVIPKPWGLLIGLGSIAGGIYVVYAGV